ncbi:MAG: glycosyltransferase [Patescibacteria group bacterium]
MALRLIIAIPSYKRPGALGTLLSQLDAQTGNDLFEVYILNDGNDPASAALLAGLNPSRFRLHIRATGVPSGLPRARNFILDWIAEERTVAPTLVCFLDDDCEVNTFFVHETLYAGERYEAFAFRIETIGQSGIVNTRRNGVLSWLLKPLFGRALLWCGVIRGGYFEAFDQPRRVDHLPGGCLIYRFDRYPRLRFDELLNDGNAILEDTDFSQALRVAGARLLYLGYYGILHRPGTTGGVRVRVPREKYYYYWKHTWYLVGKWSSRAAYLLAFPVGFAECVLLSLMTRTWLGGALLRSFRVAWTQTWSEVRAMDSLRICSPQSGINPTSTLGGEVYDAELLAALAARGIPVDVILPRNRRFRDAGVAWQVHHMRAYRTSFGYYRALIRAIAARYRKQPFSILRIHSPYIMAIPCLLWAAFHPAVRVWAHYHHVEERFVSRVITWLVARRWDIVSVSSETTRTELERVYLVPANRIVVAYPGLGVSSAPSAVRTEALRHEYGLADMFMLLHVGSLNRRKNVAFLIDLLATLPEHIVLAVIGRGPERERLERQASLTKVRHRVAFLDAVSQEEKAVWMCAADLFVLASRKEGFGMAVAEAAACGTPAVVSDQGSLPEIVQDGVTGRVCALTLDAWRDAISAIVNNPHERERMSAAARRFMHERFSWDRSAALVADHLARIV